MNAYTFASCLKNINVILAISNKVDISYVNIVLLGYLFNLIYFTWPCSVIFLFYLASQVARGPISLETISVNMLIK